MSQEVFEIVQGMDLKDIETQLALQCAPVITGVKISNLLIVKSVNKENVHKVKQILENSTVSYYVLLEQSDKTTILLYKKQQLSIYLSLKENRSFLKDLGYHETSLNNSLQLFASRYKNYIEERESFPHELGLFLGYPIEDVKGFIKNEGQNFLYKGYWKVYENLAEKKNLFQSFENSKEILIHLVSAGISVADIIKLYHNNDLLKALV